MKTENSRSTVFPAIGSVGSSGFWSHRGTSSPLPIMLLPQPSKFNYQVIIHHIQWFGPGKGWVSPVLRSRKVFALCTGSLKPLWDLQLCTSHRKTQKPGTSLMTEWGHHCHGAFYGPQTTGCHSQTCLKEEWGREHDEEDTFFLAHPSLRGICR